MEEAIEPKKKKKKKKKKPLLSKDLINIIRTTMRNNIELTNIADNKANVLLSLNGIMLTFCIPLILGNTDMLLDKGLYLPLMIMGITCFTTMYLSTTVLKPSHFEKFQDKGDEVGRFSPFFFGNFYKMEINEFYGYIDQSMAEEKMIKQHLIQDLFYIGKRLGYKMNRVRLAFNIFIAGIFFTLMTLIIVLSF